MHFFEAFDFNKQTSLYIHVPFCKSKCSYCAFYSKCENKESIDKYFDKLIQELDLLIQRMQEKPFYTAYIGGGNPGCLSIAQLEILCSKICTCSRPVEFTIEMNPESLTTDHFHLFERYLNRLSMGVQSLDSNTLKFLGRNASYEDTLRGMQLAEKLRDKTNCKLSFDLITCLGNWHDYMDDVQGIVDVYKPNHLSVYALTLEEGTLLYKQKPVLPDADEQSVILENIWNYLDSIGYKQYEVSNFAFDGNASLHNSVYWDYQQYVGLGPAAASTGFVENKVYRVESKPDISGYINEETFGNYQITSLSQDESLEEFVLMGLRHTKGLDLERLKNSYGKEIKEIPEGYSIIGSHLVPNKKGLMVADWAASKVLTSIDT